MIKELTVRVTPKTAAVHDELKLYISTIEDLDINSITSIRIVKRSIDARQRNVMVNLKVQVFINEVAPNKPLVAPIEYNNISNCKEAVVVGAGPAGLFAALRLIELGVRPIVVERGKNVDDRLKDVAKISREGIVDPESNYCFGEGGAGAYSDG